MRRIAIALVFAVFFVAGVSGAIINPLPYIFQNGTTADATQVNVDLAQILANVNANAAPLQGGFLVPSGAVVSFNLAVCPPGWTASDGNNGTADLRGEFVRGLDTGGSVDPGRTLATAQIDSFQDHTHFYSSPGGVVGAGGGAVNASIVFGATSGTAASGTHGAETRPKNVALLMCQKS